MSASIVLLITEYLQRNTVHKSRLTRPSKLCKKCRPNESPISRGKIYASRTIRIKEPIQPYSQPLNPCDALFTFPSVAHLRQPRGGWFFVYDHDTRPSRKTKIGQGYEEHSWKIFRHCVVLRRFDYVYANGLRSPSAWS